LGCGICDRQEEITLGTCYEFAEEWDREYVDLIYVGNYVDWGDCMDKCDQEAQAKGLISQAGGHFDN